MTTESDDYFARFQRDGFLILKDFLPANACDDLRARAEQLVREFDPAGVVSIFTTHEQSRTSDEYFLDPETRFVSSSKRMRFLPDGTLKQTKERSINKIGHALHRARSRVQCTFHNRLQSENWLLI